MERKRFVYQALGVFIVAGGLTPPALGQALKEVDVRVKTSYRRIFTEIETEVQQAWTNLQKDNPYCRSGSYRADGNSSSKLIDDDRRGRNQRYFCQEYPFGKTSLGVAPNDYQAELQRAIVKANGACPPFWAKASTTSGPSRATFFLNKEIGLPGGQSLKCSDLAAEAYQCHTKRVGRGVRQECRYRLGRGGENQLIARLKGEVKKWEKDKLALKFPFQFRDKKKTRTYDVSVLVGRENRQGSVEIAHLNSKSKRTVRTSKDLNDDLYLQFVPKGNNLYTYICVFKPGLRIHAPEVRVKYTVADTPLGSVSAKGEVNFGNLTFNYVKLCGMVRVSVPTAEIAELRNGRAAIKAEVLTLSPLAFRDARFSGIRLRVTSRWANLLGRLTDIFTGNDMVRQIERNLEEDMNSELKLVARDLHTGHWIAQYLGNNNRFTRLVKQDFEKASRALIQRDSERNANPIALGNATDLIEMQCRSSAENITDPILQAFTLSQCERIEGSVRAFPFADDPTSKSRMCYSHYARSKDGAEKSNNRWWTTSQYGCSLNTVFKVSTLPQFESATNCFASLASSAIETGSADSRSCLSQIQNSYNQVLENYPDLVSITNEIAQLVQRGQKPTQQQIDELVREINEAGLDQIVDPSVLEDLLG